MAKSTRAALPPLIGKNKYLNKVLSFLYLYKWLEVIVNSTNTGTKHHGNGEENEGRFTTSIREKENN